MESNGLNSTKPSQMVKWCLVASISTQAVKQLNRIDQIEQMESNGFHSIKSSQIVKWCLVASATGFKASESNGSNRSNGVEWTPFD